MIGKEPGRAANGDGGVWKRRRGLGFVRGIGSFVFVVELESEGKVEDSQLSHSLAVFADSLLSRQLVLRHIVFVRCVVVGHCIGL